MAGSDLLTIAEAAAKLNLSEQRVHQLLSAGQLEGVDLPPGRLRHVPSAPRVTTASVEDLRGVRDAERSGKAAVQEAARAPRHGQRGSGTTAPAAAAPDVGASRGTDVASARAAAQELKVGLDTLREEVRKERARTEQAVEVAAGLIEMLRDSFRSGDRLDEVVDGYSDALTQLLSPNVPPDGR